MDRRRLLAGFGLAPFVSEAASAAFPDRPITLVSGYAPGGSTDIAARLVAEAVSGPLGPGARVVVENRPGASGTVACEWLRRQAPDGYTLLLSESSSFAIWPAMHAEGTKYDPLRDFSWVAAVCTSPLVLIVSPDFPAKTLADAMEVLRSSRSESLDYSSSGVGSIPHISAELVRQVLGAGNRSRHVPYRGGGPAALSVSKSETAWSVSTLGSTAGMIQGGLVRALAMTSPKRFAAFPDVPTFSESGYRDIELDVFYLVHAPPALPEDVSRTLGSAMAAGLQTPVIRDRLLQAGMQAWSGTNTSASTRGLVEGELARFKEIARRTGLRIT